jgi:hypothetical protein
MQITGGGEGKAADVVRIRYRQPLRGVGRP